MTTQDDPTSKVAWTEIDIL